MTIFGDSNFQTINNNNHNNNSLTNQVVCEAPPAGRPWFGDEKLEKWIGRVLIAVLILIAIYLAVAIIKRLCKARRRCLRRATGKTHKKHKKSHKRHHRSRRSDYLSPDDTDSQPDSPRPAESLADTDVSDYESVSHASGECAPVTDSDAAAVPSPHVSPVAAQQEAVRAFNARNSEAPALAADKTTTESSRCVRCCYRIPIVVRWILVAVFAYVVISLVIFPFPLREPTVEVASWIIRYVLPERVSLYQVYSFISNVWYWADWLQVHYLKVLGVLTSLTGIVVWLFNAAPKKAN